MIDSKRLKKQILEVAFKANKGHIGSALSISDLLSSVFNYLINTDSLDEQKNCVTLSKGHAALALYSCLAQLNLISNQELFGYESDGSLLGTHPDPELPWVNFIGGSLGQGIAFASGLALADHYAGKQRNHYVILSDSELNAGVVWEIATIVGTKKLNNLTVLLDNNQQQALDLTKNILVYEDVATSFRVLGWDVTEVDGHNELEILKTLGKSHNKPHLVICKTSFGAGISFMEGNISWHYLPLSNELYEKAMNEIEVSS